jgi:hypothetical protein
MVCGRAKVKGWENEVQEEQKVVKREGLVHCLL